MEMTFQNYLIFSVIIFIEKKKVRFFDLPKFNCIKNSIFFSKGVTLLYYKNNLNLIKRSIELSKGGSFDFSISKKEIKKKTQYWL